MRTAFLAALLTFSVIGTGTGFTAANHQLASIQPLSATLLDEMTGQPTRYIICTAWPTRDAQNMSVWVTAAHCVMTDRGVRTDIRIGDKPAAVKHVDLTHDVAILSGGPRAGLLFLALAEPDVLESLWSAGYPHASSSLHAVVGAFSNSADADDDISLYSLPVAGGMSGAPVVHTKSGLVIGMITQSECPNYWCAVSRGTNVMKIRQVLGQAQAR